MSDPMLNILPFAFDEGATFSECRRYRYHLWQTWGDRENRVAFIGLNPSTADEIDDDHTIRKCIGFAKRWGYGAIDMVNLFAWCSTEPKGLRDPEDAIGPDNNPTLERVTSDAKRVVLAWGSHAEVKGLIQWRVRSLQWLFNLEDVRTKMVRLGTCKDGNPRHPLMLAYATNVEAV